MPTERVARRLAAILAADVAGYSRLMGQDEEGTVARLKIHRRELIDPKIAEHRGRVVKTTGDGILIEFPSVVDALWCAIEMQRGMAERNAAEPRDARIEFRIGINLGDIISDDDDIHGDGVNIAARLEGLAEPGGIYVSQTVLDHTRGKIAFEAEDRGEQSLKNIARRIHVYRILVDRTRQEAPPQQGQNLALPDRPSIAVLPFLNMSVDPEQEYFADGIVEEIITALSRFRQLFVIARNSSFAYKGKSPDVRQVGRELGVRYVLEGSVRKAASKLRITGQLIDASTGSHLWADRFDGDFEDVFELQDQVTASVVGAIAPQVEKAEIERAKSKSTGSLDAYDCFLRGMAAYYYKTHASREACDEARRLFGRAIELDPDFAAAHAFAAMCYLHRKASGWTIDPAGEAGAAEQLARRAVALSRDDALVQAAAGAALAFVVRDLDAGAALFDRALALNPNLAFAWHWGGYVKLWLGEPDAAVEHIARAMRLSPMDPAMPRMQAAMADAHFHAGRYDEASAWAEMAIRGAPDFHNGLRAAAVSNAFAGKLDLAQRAVARLRQIDPTLRVSNVQRGQGPYRRSEDIARYEEAMRKAGLPER